MDIFNNQFPKPTNIKEHLGSIIPKFCDRCGTKHAESDAEVVRQTKEGMLFKLTCQTCSNTYMFHVASPMNGMVAAKRMKYKSEISAKEMQKYLRKDVQRIDQDEQIDVFQGLEDINTIEDFNKLF